MTDSSPEPIRVEVDDRGVATVTMQRPEVRNAFDPQLIGALSDAVDRLAADAAVGAVVLTGTGGAFSAGADLNWMRAQADASPEDNAADAARMEAMYRRLWLLPKPLICRVDGPALGGGAGLVVVGDVAVASNRSVIGFPEVRLGIAPAVISPYVVRRCGYGPARAAFVTGRRFHAHDAWRLGLVDEVVGTDELDDAVQGWLGSALKAAPSSVAAIKELLEGDVGRPLDEVQADTTALIARLRASDDGQEGMAAFLERRAPAWSSQAG